MTDTPDNDGVGWTETNIPIPVIVPGCTDPLYVEYDALATEDDGSCATLIVNGCTDSDYLEYDASANTDDGSCATCRSEWVYRCRVHLDYDATANTDDGSCATCRSEWMCRCEMHLDYTMLLPIQMMVLVLHCA